MAKGKGQSNTRRDLVSQEIFDKAAMLFAERGFPSTSLQEVADSLGISRTALYYYVGGKEELLTKLVRGLSQTTAERLAEIAADESLDPLEKLRAATVEMASRIASSPGRFRLLLAAEGSLPEPLLSEHREARRRTLQELTSMIRTGIESGLVRPADDRVAAFALLGMCNWVAWWYQPERGDSAEQIAVTLGELAVASLRAPSGRAPEGKAGIDHALALLNQDLDYLRRALDGHG